MPRPNLAAFAASPLSEGSAQSHKLVRAFRARDWQFVIEARLAAAMRG